MARRKTTRRKTGTAATRRKRTTRKKKSSGFVNFFVPMIFIVCILFCLGFLLVMGYRTAAASSFFEVEKVEMHGVNNIDREKIQKIVKAHALKQGVWNADIEAIRGEIANFRYTRQVSVSRVLPDTVRVVVQERIPKVIVRLDGVDFWADEDGLLLDRVENDDKRPPFTMFGWSDRNQHGARENNKKRVALYLELLENWKSFDLAKRVKAVDLSDIRDPQAIVEDSGRTVRILLSEEDYGKRLQRGIENIAGRGKEIESIDMSGTNPVVSFRNS